ncbi:hypothetical protein Patl1_36203 [Pistacia atlantica]|nr:hypothetical protein Patl1_36203 [Pistacia atlantica]
MDTLNNRVEDCGEGAKGESSEEEDGPPADDCCPICFGDFTIPCKANCGHWDLGRTCIWNERGKVQVERKLLYVAKCLEVKGSCILQFWNYSSASRPCKCPMCSRYIRRLTPEASLCHRQEHEITEVLKNVLRYNRLFVGGTRGLLQMLSYGFVPAVTCNYSMVFMKVCELPLFIKRIFLEMMDPDREDYLHEMRLLQLYVPECPLCSHSVELHSNSDVFGCTLHIVKLNGNFGIVRVFDYAAIALVVILRLIGIYRRRRLNQRVRRLAATQPEPANE